MGLASASQVGEDDLGLDVSKPREVPHGRMRGFEIPNENKGEAAAMSRLEDHGKHVMVLAPIVVAREDHDGADVADHPTKGPYDVESALIDITHRRGHACVVPSPE